MQHMWERVYVCHFVAVAIPNRSLFRWYSSEYIGEKNGFCIGRNNSNNERTKNGTSASAMCVRIPFRIEAHNWLLDIFLERERARSRDRSSWHDINCRLNMCAVRAIVFRNNLMPTSGSSFPFAFVFHLFFSFFARRRRRWHENLNAKYMRRHYSAAPCDFIVYNPCVDVVYVAGDRTHTLSLSVVRERKWHPLMALQQNSHKSHLFLFISPLLSSSSAGRFESHRPFSLESQSPPPTRFSLSVANANEIASTIC